MKYFQTDDRDDYFASLEKNSKRKTPTSYTLIDITGKKVLKQVPAYTVRKFVKNTYPETGNAKRIWRIFIESKGYKVVKNYENPKCCEKAKNGESVCPDCKWSTTEYQTTKD